MPVVAIVNPKGGVGKTTLATNLAGAFASGGHRTMLGDFDRQQSARDWLALRPASVAPIESWEQSELRRPPRGVTHVVLDTPAQIDSARLAALARVADRLLVPMQPSMFDMLAMQRFLVDLRELLRRRPALAGRVAVVGVRVDARTRAADEFARFVRGLGLPVAGSLRDTQNYVKLAAHGLTVFDLPAQRLPAERASWDSLLRWVDA